MFLSLCFLYVIMLVTQYTGLIVSMLVLTILDNIARDSCFPNKTSSINPTINYKFVKIQTVFNIIGGGHFSNIAFITRIW